MPIPRGFSGRAYFSLGDNQPELRYFGQTAGEVMTFTDASGSVVLSPPLVALSVSPHRG